MGNLSTSFSDLDLDPVVPKVELVQDFFHNLLHSNFMVKAFFSYHVYRPTETHIDSRDIEGSR